MSRLGQQRWDRSSRGLLQAALKDVLTWLCEGVELIGECEEGSRLSGEMQSLQLRADELCRVQVGGRPCLFHIEFQARGDAQMANRLLEYNIVARRLYNQEVFSWVIYLRAGGETPPSPLRWPGLHEGEADTLSFSYGVVKLWEVPVEDLLRLDLPGIWPLAPLCRGGRRYEVVERVLTGLEQAKEHQRISEQQMRDILVHAKTLADLTFQGHEDFSRVQRRFEMLREIYRESPAVQEWLAEGRAQGLSEGRAQGLSEGRAQGLSEGRLAASQEHVLSLLARRFPSLVPELEPRIRSLQDPDLLGDLLLRLSEIFDPQAARALFLTDSDSSGQDQ
ncbi:Rpn family recombination-promoting nuclease/putative transposase [Thermogemmatispora sp.]|uniref:Rpn family recombination-promoting nuclease/putative transposase n=1 Tax=Thermogemmatispora sp. TaxID=1968838 RepID=UPI0035E42288